MLTRAVAAASFHGPLAFITLARHWQLGAFQFFGSITDRPPKEMARVQRGQKNTGIKTPWRLCR